MSILYLATFVAAFLLSTAFVVLLTPLCLSLGHVDEPGGRKKHRMATPLNGGMAITASIVLLGLVLLPTWQLLGFVFGICSLLALGIRDDYKHVPAPLRLLIQMVAVGVGMCALGGVRLTSIGDLLGMGNTDLGIWSVPFTIFAAVGVINAVNMIDGIDGLAGGFAVLIIGVFIGAAADTSVISSQMLYISIGSVAGFLVFNLRTPWQRQARVFLGDAGSLVLGFVLVWFAVKSTQGYSPALHPITVVWLLGLPLSDTIYLMASRLLRGKSPLHADRYHFHHLLLRAGLSPGWALYTWLATAAVFIAIGCACEYAGVSQAVMFGGFLFAFASYCVLLTIGWRAMINGHSPLHRSFRG